MLHIRETIHKTKLCFYKTLQNLKSFCYGKCQKLPKLPSFNPFSCGGGRGSRKEYQIDQFYIKFCDEWEASLDKAKESYNTSLKASKEHKKEEEAEEEEEDACRGSFIKFSKQSPLKGNKQQGVEEEQKNKESPQIGKEESCSKKTNQGGLVLAQKMKDLEMMETDDVEHVLDVEEALHYYSRLTSPLYVDIVDKFFTDMYTEFSAPQVSNSINTSMRRFGSNSIRL